jgi:hypothetical protein
VWYTLVRVKGKKTIGGRDMTTERQQNLIKNIARCGVKVNISQNAHTGLYNVGYNDSQYDFDDIFRLSSDEVSAYLQGLYRGLVTASNIAIYKLQDTI